ncbi:MAG: hypothetical protein GF364_02745, partial [Candidatus Lokiarchaeota archaeon]|nr:hypothetical protein [Candidatus Lokiarchaeota archaeon]
MKARKEIFRNGTKIAWLLIALGFLLGGIAGILQDPSPTASDDGWTIANMNLDIHPIRIPDQNDDGVSDIFYWVNAPYSNMDLSYDSKWNNTAGAIIVDGKTGSIIMDEQYGGNNLWDVAPNWGSRGDRLYGVYTNGSYVVISAVPRLVDYSWDIPKWSLLKISLEDLSIIKRVNLTANGWEPMDEWYEGYVQDYQPNIRYLRDLSMTTADTSYTGDVIVIENNLRFKNDGVPGYNESKVQFSFINPDSLETITKIIWNENPINSDYASDFDFKWGFCEGPQLDTEMQWRYPYFYAISYNISSYDSTVNLSMTTLDNLRNNTASINWLIKEKPLGKFAKSDFYYFLSIDAKCLLSLDETGNPSSISVLQTYRGDIDNPIEENKRNGEFGPLGWGQYLDVIAASRLTCIHFDGSVDTTLSFESKINHPDYVQHIYGITDISPLGVCIDILPIKLFNDERKNTTISVITSPQIYKTFEINHRNPGFGETKIYYPYTNHSVFFLPQNLTGVVKNTTTMYLNSLPRTDIVSTSYLLYDDVTECVNFDYDGDNKTDILLSGTILDVRYIESKEFGPITGPFFIVTYNRSIIQYQFWDIYTERMVAISDSNNDGVSDVLIEPDMCAFTQTSFDEKKTEWELKMEDPTAKILFFIGITMIIVALVITLVVSRKMKDTTMRLEAYNTKRLIIMLVLAIVAIALLYQQLLNLMEEAERELGYQLGQTPEFLS